MKDVVYYRECILRIRDPSLTTEELISWLELALDTDPKRAADVLRIAKGLRNLSERTAGKAYIAELEKRVRELRKIKKKSKAR